MMNIGNELLNKIQDLLNGIPVVMTDEEYVQTVMYWVINNLGKLDADFIKPGYKLVTAG